METIYTTKDIASKLNITYHAVNKLIAQKKLRATRLREPGPWTITEKAFRDYLQKKSEGYLGDI
jgi:excisionase family DNA binding protein